MDKEEEFEKWRLSFSKQIKWDNIWFVPKEDDEKVAIQAAQALVTDLELMSMDMLEYNVEASENKQAKEMLAAIGIKCND